MSKGTEDKTFDEAMIDLGFETEQEQAERRGETPSHVCDYCDTLPVDNAGDVCGACIKANENHRYGRPLDPVVGATMAAEYMESREKKQDAGNEGEGEDVKRSAYFIDAHRGMDGAYEDPEF